MNKKGIGVKRDGVSCDGGWLKFQAFRSGCGVALCMRGTELFLLVREVSAVE